MLEHLPNTYHLFFGKFSCLTPAQKALIQPILEKRDVVLQADTGSGKTEAILAPSTERLITHPDHFTILYIVPTRALALDMHRRIHPLYKQLELKSGIRTGDRKTQQGAAPHLLILTPESLDVLMGSQNPENKYFLKHVRILIIDEVHAFLRTERGTQLSHLRRRLEIQSKGDLQTLTLSATIAYPEEISALFHLKNVFYYQKPSIRKLEPHWVHILDEKRELVPFFDDLLSYWKCKKILVFVNSRKKCEQLFEILNYEGSFAHHILLHYSNLSTKKRLFIESSFRKCKHGVCISTSTLEMGIDIGDIDGVVLMGPPSSTMDFLQRIGRGNRRHHTVKFWGVCYGAESERQLLRFLALFELSLKNTMERSSSARHYSVLFQQILSCLYAKKRVSFNALKMLFNEEELPSILHTMTSKSWLHPLQGEGLLVGGWRYGKALKKQQIWSNFPPTDEEYQVILDKEVIATLPVSVIKQLEIGDVFQLAGKTLKLIQIQEKKTSQEALVENSDEPVTTEFSWCGCLIPIAFEVAQAIKSVVLDTGEPQGLLTRTGRLLNNTRIPYIQGENGLYVHRLQSGAYRYETFLGTIGNFILYHQILDQLASKVRGLFLSFDELGIESNEWIAFKTLSLPYTTLLFQEWVYRHLPLLRKAFPWNSWLYSLPEDCQKKEISSSLLDERVLEHFKHYSTFSMPEPPPLLVDMKPMKQCIPLEGTPWSFEEERRAWEKLSFPDIPQNVDLGLTASQLQSYVSKRTCPRLAYFQRVGFSIKPHPRFHIAWEKSDFKETVFATLEHVRFETGDFTLIQAIDEVLISQTPLFLAQAKLAITHPFSMRGVPDLIYLKPEGSLVRLEVWDIKDQEHCTYAQKWRLTFYVYLLKTLLQGFPVIISEYAGLVHRSGGEQKRTSFRLIHFTSWINRLIIMWRADSLKGANDYSLNSNCTTCRYFSYCYQETLFKSPTPVHEPGILCTAQESLGSPPDIHDWPSLQAFLQKHFHWPIDGPLTAIQVIRCLGLMTDPPVPRSVYHEEPVPPEVYQQIWNWSTAHVKITRSRPSSPKGLMDSYLCMQRREWEERTFVTLAFQKNPLSTRVAEGRAIGPLVFLRIDREGRKSHYVFSFDSGMPIAKFRIGDFLKLAPLNSSHIQEGFSVVLTAYIPEEGSLSVQSLSNKIPVSKNQCYMLDECATDWNAPKVEEVLHRLKNPHFRPELMQMLSGYAKNTSPSAVEWIEQWYALHAKQAGLNAMQKQALLLPFLYPIGLIEGPPGTGKTHLLVWTLIALIAHAQSIHRPIKILVTALTHHAIDHILLKLVHTMDSSLSSIPIWKYERSAETKEDIALLQDVELLMKETSFILGATGFGVYQLFDDKHFPQIFDWVVFDEASQMLPSYAMLGLVFGKGNALFYGDTQQLAPVVISDIQASSILEELSSRFHSPYRLRLNETYRMNAPLCDFVSRHWYDQELHSAVPNQRLQLLGYPLFNDAMDADLDPLKCLNAVLIEHEGNLHSSKEEALWIAKVVRRLIVEYAVPVDAIGIISPHRLQNNTILKVLKEIFPLAIQYPRIDTVERMQGQEFDLVLFSATVSDRESVHNAFLKDYRRLNVSITRARKKFLFVASPVFFQTFPRTEKELSAHFPFEDFLNLGLMNQ